MEGFNTGIESLVAWVILGGSLLKDNFHRAPLTTRYIFGLIVLIIPIAHHLLYSSEEQCFSHPIHGQRCCATEGLSPDAKGVCLHERNIWFIFAGARVVNFFAKGISSNYWVITGRRSILPYEVIWTAYATWAMVFTYVLWFVLVGLSIAAEPKLEEKWDTWLEERGMGQLDVALYGAYPYLDHPFFSWERQSLILFTFFMAFARVGEYAGFAMDLLQVSLSRTAKSFVNYLSWLESSATGDVDKCLRLLESYLGNYPEEIVNIEAARQYYERVLLAVDMCPSDGIQALRKALLRVTRAIKRALANCMSPVKYERWTYHLQCHRKILQRLKVLPEVIQVAYEDNRDFCHDFEQTVVRAVAARRDSPTENGNGYFFAKLRSSWKLTQFLPWVARWILFLSIMAWLFMCVLALILLLAFSSFQDSTFAFGTRLLDRKEDPLGYVAIGILLFLVPFGYVIAIQNARYLMKWIRYVVGAWDLGRKWVCGTPIKQPMNWSGESMSSLLLGTWGFVMGFFVVVLFHSGYWSEEQLILWDMNRATVIFFGAWDITEWGDGLSSGVKLVCDLLVIPISAAIGCSSLGAYGARVFIDSPMHILLGWEGGESRFWAAYESIPNFVRSLRIAQYAWDSKTRTRTSGRYQQHEDNEEGRVLNVGPFAPNKWMTSDAGLDANAKLNWIMVRILMLYHLGDEVRNSLIPERTESDQLMLQSQPIGELASIVLGMPEQQATETLAKLGGFPYRADLILALCQQAREWGVEQMEVQAGNGDGQWDALMAEAKVLYNPTATYGTLN